MVRRSLSRLCRPKAWATTTEEPTDIPLKKPIIKSEGPTQILTAARASFPTNLPTIRASTLLYRFCSSSPNMMGMENSSSCCTMLPRQKSIPFDFKETLLSISVIWIDAPSIIPESMTIGKQIFPEVGKTARRDGLLLILQDPCGIITSP